MSCGDRICTSCTNAATKKTSLHLDLSRECFGDSVGGKLRGFLPALCCPDAAGTYFGFCGVCLCPSE